MLRPITKVYYALLVGMVILFVLPLAPIFIWSFAGEWRFPQLFPTLSSRAWRYVFSPYSQLFESVANSIWLALGTCILSQLFAYPAARALGLYVQRWKKAIRIVLIAPIIIPNVSIAMGIHIAFVYLGLSDQWVGVQLAHLIPALPYSIYILYGFYAQYDVNIERQFRLLGANRWQIFWHVELRLLRSVLSLSLLFSFLISWSQYLLTVFIGGGSLITLPMQLFSLLSSGDFPLLSALSVTFIIPALLVVIVNSYGLKHDPYGPKELKSFERI